MKRRKKLLIVYLCLFFTFTNNMQIFASNQNENNLNQINENELYAKSCALMDGDTGRVLFGKNQAIPMANASTTKILTCIVALENSEMDSVVTASANAAGQPKVHLGMKTDEQFYLKDLLYALMLESYNDCAVAIAEYICGTTKDFARLMNEKANDIGCKNTYFITPNGLDAKENEAFHHTTAEDLCKIMKYCAWESEKKVEFLKITQTIQYSFTDIKGRTFHCTNHNAFLSMMDGVISGKTGFTGNAGYCYVAALEKDGKRYCIALLACGWPNNRSYKWTDAKKLFNYGIDFYEKKNICQIPQFEKIKIMNGKNENATLSDWRAEVYITPYIKETEKELWYLVCSRDSWTTKVKWSMRLNSTISRKQEIGKVFVFLNGDCIKTYSICADKTVNIWKFTSLLNCILREYIKI